jgi:hypothetical protein
MDICRRDSVLLTSSNRIENLARALSIDYERREYNTILL